MIKASSLVRGGVLTKGRTIAANSSGVKISLACLKALVNLSLKRFLMRFSVASGSLMLEEASEKDVLIEMAAFLHFSRSTYLYPLTNYDDSIYSVLLDHF